MYEESQYFIIGDLVAYTQRAPHEFNVDKDSSVTNSYSRKPIRIDVDYIFPSFKKLKLLSDFVVRVFWRL